MKKNIDILIILFVCLLVSSALYILYDNANKQSISGNVVALRHVGSNVHSHVRASSSSNSTFSGGIGGGDSWTPAGMSGRGVSSSRVARVSVLSPSPMRSKAQDISYSPISSVVTSSPTNITRNIALGSNSKGSISMGGTMIANSSQIVTYGGFATPNLSLSKNRRNSKSAQSSVVENGEIAAAPQSYVSSLLNVSPLLSFGYTSNSYTSSFSSTSTSLYRDATSSYGTVSGPYRASAQHRAPPTAGDAGLGSTWGNWLDEKWSSEDFGGTLDSNGDVWFTEEEAREIYDTMFGDGYWNDGMGTPPSWEDFLAWLRTKGGKYHLPVGNMLPLLLMALAYVVFVFISKCKN